ncbi:MAG: hypothetical protein M3083_07685 [Actinomycetota bacterium]|nr:hypothetical protein [Actinomycetota bacterium]
MPKVDPETHEMTDDSPSGADDERGGKVSGDPTLHDASETGRTASGLSSEKKGHTEVHDGVLPGEKPTIGQ